MVNIDTKTIAKLREQTGAGIMECRKALIEAEGNTEEAQELLKQSGLAKAEKRSVREVLQGLVEVYSHSGGKVGSVIELNCETDFVARTDEFKNLAHDLAMQIAAMNPDSVEALLEQDYIRDPSKTVKELIIEVISKTGENIKVKRFARFGLEE